ncbi:MAG: ABC transporter permease [Candidatus Aminicenantes bacterium]|nr:ABC transporter permease [Candidatus Aminicenantes bacterium]
MGKTKAMFTLPEKVSVRNLSGLTERFLKLRSAATLEIDWAKVEECEISGLAFLTYLKAKHGNVLFKNVPEDMNNALAQFSSESFAEAKTSAKPPPQNKLEVLTDRFLALGDSVRKFFVLLADEVFHTVSYLKKPGGIYPGEILNQLYFMGYKSFPIVCLITFLVGVTISMTSAAQLRLFGADIYLSYLVGVAMIRELVPLMTGIILAGKIGAAITAEIATMQVLEEIDALKTMGVVPEKFLMVPRLIAMTLSIPILVVLADFVGILGGVLVAELFLGIPPSAFIREMLTIVALPDFLIGMVKTLVFGWAVVVSSSFKGFFVQRSAEEVGIATTDSVVLSISLIIVLDCLFAFVLY